jgi:hypothetical protein
MSKSKFYFALAAAFIFVISTILCTWIALRYAGILVSTPPAHNANIASPQASITPDIPPVQPAHSPAVLGANFIGHWTGHWDNALAARFQISRGTGKQLLVAYEYEEAPGQPKSTKILHPFASNTVLHMPRAAVTLTLSNTQPNTAQGVGDFIVDGLTLKRTATFIRNGDSPKTNWLAGDSSGGGVVQPIVLDIKATIDGSDVLSLSPAGAVWTHKSFQWPTAISVNRIAWDAQTTPILRDTGLEDADFSTAWVISRSGRDTVAMEHTSDGAAISFDDAPAGSASYEIKIGLTHKTSTGGITPHPSDDPIFLDVQANINGSDCLIISPTGAQWSHRTGESPTDVKINGVPWNVQAQSTTAEIGLSSADLSSATVAQRSGRDALVVEKTNTTALAIYFDDSPGGSAPYEIKIRFDRK